MVNSFPLRLSLWALVSVWLPVSVSAFVSVFLIISLPLPLSLFISLYFVSLCLCLLSLSISLCMCLSAVCFSLCRNLISLLYCLSIYLPFPFSMLCLFYSLLPLYVSQHDLTTIAKIRESTHVKTPADGILLILSSTRLNIAWNASVNSPQLSFTNGWVSVHVAYIYMHRKLLYIEFAGISTRTKLLLYFRIGIYVADSNLLSLTAAFLGIDRLDFTGSGYLSDHVLQPMCLS